jgi:hypothetical protein
MAIARCSLLSVTALAVAFASGCVAEASAPAGAEDVGASTEALGSTVRVSSPTGELTASVIANGSGCPAGTWDPTFSPDGERLTIRFSMYEATVNPGQALQIKDCTLAIVLIPRSAASFAVSSVDSRGGLWLDQPGMSGRETEAHYWLGGTRSSTTFLVNETGPFTQTTQSSSPILPADRVWSACGPSSRLTAQTRVVLQNNTQRTGTGYFNNTSDDAETSTTLTFGIVSRGC